MAEVMMKRFVNITLYTFQIKRMGNDDGGWRNRIGAESGDEEKQKKKKKC